MLVVVSHPGTHRWMVPVFLCCCALVLLMAMPRGAATHGGIGVAPMAAVSSGPTVAVTGDAWPANAPAEAIDATLTLLRSGDEAALREPFMGMRLAERAFRSGGDAWSAGQLSRWAGIFATRLDQVTIPTGTRAALAGLLAVYEHDVLTDGATMPRPGTAQQAAFASDADPGVLTGAATGTPSPR